MSVRLAFRLLARLIPAAALAVSAAAAAPHVEWQPPLEIRAPKADGHYRETQHGEHPTDTTQRPVAGAVATLISPTMAQALQPKARPLLAPGIKAPPPDWSPTSYTVPPTGVHASIGQNVTWLASADGPKKPDPSGY